MTHKALIFSFRERSIFNAQRERSNALLGVATPLCGVDEDGPQARSYNFARNACRCPANAPASIDKELSAFAAMCSGITMKT
jgi:hypothetical protein